MGTLYQENFWKYFLFLGFLFFFTVSWVFLRVRKSQFRKHFLFLNIFLGSFIFIFLFSRIFVLLTEGDENWKKDYGLYFLGFIRESIGGVRLNSKAFSLVGGMFGLFIYFIPIFLILGARFRCSALYFFEIIAPCFFLFFSFLALGRCFFIRERLKIVFIVLELLFHLFFFIFWQIISLLFKLDGEIHLLTDSTWAEKRAKALTELKGTRFYQWKFWNIYMKYLFELGRYWNRTKKSPKVDIKRAPEAFYRDRGWILSPEDPKKKPSFLSRTILRSRLFKRDSAHLTAYFNPHEIRFFYVGALSSLELAWFFLIDALLFSFKFYNRSFFDVKTTSIFVTLIPYLLFALFGMFSSLFFQFFSPRHLRSRNYFYETQY